MSQTAPSPNFFILGAEKAGTTTLHTQLGKHPDVCVSEPKEPHFFDLRYEEGLDGYAEMAFAHHDGEPVVGEATPTYLNLPYVADRIAEDVPDAKLVIVLRDPVERAYSAWWMFRVRQLEHLDFEDAIQRNLEEIEEGISFQPPKGEETWRAYVEAIRDGQSLAFRTYTQGGWYAQQIQAYRDRFPDHNIQIHLAEDLNDDHQDVLEDVWSFIGAPSPYPELDPRVENAAMGRYASWIIRVAQWTRVIKLAHHVPQSWRMLFKEATSWMGDRPPLDPQVEAEVRELFAPHVHKLEREIDRDVSHWLPDHK